MLKAKNFLIPASLLLFLFMSGCSAENSESGKEGASQKNSKTENSSVAVNADRVIIYYFHTNARCWSCKQFEKLTKEVLDENYTDEISDSTIEYMAVNVEEEKNKHFVDDYNLISKSLVLSLRDGKKEVEWKNLDKIWQLVRNSEKYKAYVNDAIKNYLKKAG